MRNTLAVIAVCCLLLCAACTKPPVQAEFQSKYVQTKSGAEFYTVADYQTLGEVWQGAGGASAIKSIKTDAQVHRVLLELKGPGHKALWLDFSQGRKLQELNLGLPLVGADMENQQIFLAEEPATGTQSLLTVNLPSLQPGPIMNNQLDDAQILGAATHPDSKTWWYAISTKQAEDTDRVDDRSVVLYQVTPGAQEYTASIACPNIGTDCQLACLPDGSLAIASNGGIYIAADLDSQPVKIFAAPKGRQYEVFADASLEGVFWVFLKPVGNSNGTGRANSSASRGRLICLDLQGQEQGSMYTGSVPFSEMVGDWTERRCLLLQDAVGVAHADLASGLLSWPLRVADDIPLYLLPAAGVIWAMLPDSIVGIKLDDLVELGPKLAASKVINDALAEKLQPAVKALGWKWSEVQVSPLMSQTGKLTLFDTADPDSTWSQLDWSISKNHATNVLIARIPTPADEGAREMGKRGVNTWCQNMIVSLGWQRAKLVDSSRDDYELHFTYSLVPNAKPPLTCGEFQVWITDTAAFYNLDGATFEFPKDSLGISDVRRIAAGVVADKTASGLDAMLVSNAPKAGWWVAQNNGGRFLPEAEDGSSACYRLEVILERKSGGLFVLYLDAISGEVLHQVEDSFSPLANLGVTGGKYSRLGAEDKK